MKVWMIWIESEDHIWLEAAWDDATTADNDSGWREEVDRCREMAHKNGYEMRMQCVEVSGVASLFEIPTVQAEVEA